MHIVVVFVVGLLIGAGLTWGFRGYIQRRKAAASKAVSSGLGRVASDVNQAAKKF